MNEVPVMSVDVKVVSSVNFRKWCRWKAGCCPWKSRCSSSDESRSQLSVDGLDVSARKECCKVNHDTVVSIIGKVAVGGIEFANVTRILTLREMFGGFRKVSMAITVREGTRRMMETECSVRVVGTAMEHVEVVQE